MSQIILLSEGQCRRALRNTFEFKHSRLFHARQTSKIFYNLVIVNVAARGYCDPELNLFLANREDYQGPVSGAIMSAMQNCPLRTLLHI